MMVLICQWKIEYIECDNIICQDGAYDSKYNKAKCECFVKESNFTFDDMVINKAQLSELYKKYLI